MENFLSKVLRIKNIFNDCKSDEEKYLLIIDWGKKLPSMDISYKVEANKVHGCQSSLFLYSFLQNDKTFFYADSDAMISSGLVALLISAYEGESPALILQTPPRFLEEIGIHTSLSPGRAHGLERIYLKMQQDALKLLSSL